jgi:hypothetical protein
MNNNFEIIERRTGPPFRARNLFRGYAEFRLGSHAVFVHPGVCGRLSKAAHDADPHETGGVLAGRVLQDIEGNYTIVEGAAIAPRRSGSVGRISLSPDLTAELKKEATTRYPTCDVVGWWHSHLSPSGFSGVDQDNQRVWSDPSHVGLLVFARAGSRRALAYLGPESRLMETVEDGAFVSTQHRSDAKAAAAPAQTRPDDLERVAVDTALRLHHEDRGWRRLVVLMAGLSALALMGCLAGIIWLKAAINELNDPVRLVVGWSCAPRADGDYMCQVSAPVADGLEWRQNGELLSSATEGVVIKAPAGVQTSVELHQRTSDGSHQVASLVLPPGAAQGGPSSQPGNLPR